MSRRTRAFGAALGGIAAVGAGAVVAFAVTFTSTTSNPSNTFSATTVAAPTGLTATGSPTVTLGWTATASTWATGHRVYRGTASGGPYTQIAEITPRSTVSYQDTPGSGTYYYVVRGYYGTWESANSNQASVTIAADPTFVFKGTTAFIGTNCRAGSGGSGSGGERDMEQGYVGTGGNLTFTGASSAGSVVFCSRTFAAGEVLAAGTTEVRAYWSNGAGSSCEVWARLYKNGTTFLGSDNYMVPAGSGATERTFAFATAQVTFAAGDRLNVEMALGGSGKCSNSTTLHYGGATAPSRLIVPGLS